MLDLSTKAHYPLQSSISYKQWDYVHTFKPSSSLSVESGKIFSVQNLTPGLFEYEFVAKIFKDTFDHAKTTQNYGIKNLAAGIFGAGYIDNLKNVISIEKIFNCVLYEKFLVEFKLMLKKYKNFPINKIVKHLFHGSRGTEPSLIY